MLRVFRDIEDDFQTVIRGISSLPFNDAEIIIGTRSTQALKRVLSSGGVIIGYDSTTVTNRALGGAWLTADVRIEVRYGLSYAQLTKNDMFELAQSIVEAVEVVMLSDVHFSAESDLVDSDDGKVLWRVLAFTGSIVRTEL